MACHQKMSYHMTPHHILFHQLEQYMFTSETLLKCYTPSEHNGSVPATLAPVPATLAVPVPATLAPRTIPSTRASAISRPFKKRVVQSCPLQFLTPRYKDKLFWCFFIVSEGPIQYQLVGPNWFSTEKDYKIKTAERLTSVKDAIKAMKLKRSEMETELVMQEQIGITGLQALCLLHNTALTVVFGRKYIDIQPLHADKKGIIVVNQDGEYTLRYDFDGSFLQDVYANYWHMDGVGSKNGLKSVTAYTLLQLQDISRRLLLPLQDPEGKFKTKPILYQTILSKIE